MVTPTGQPRQFETMGRSVTFVPFVIKRRHRSRLIVPPVGASAVKAGLPTTMAMMTAGSPAATQTGQP